MTTETTNIPPPAPKPTQEPTPTGLTKPVENLFSQGGLFTPASTFWSALSCMICAVFCAVLLYYKRGDYAECGGSEKSFLHPMIVTMALIFSLFCLALLVTTIIGKSETFMNIR